MSFSGVAKNAMYSRYPDRVVVALLFLGPDPVDLRLADGGDEGPLGREPGRQAVLGDDDPALEDVLGLGGQASDGSAGTDRAGSGRAASWRTVRRLCLVDIGGHLSNALAPGACLRCVRGRRPDYRCHRSTRAVFLTGPGGLIAWMSYDCPRPHPPDRAPRQRRPRGRPGRGQRLAAFTGRPPGGSADVLLGLLRGRRRRRASAGRARHHRRPARGAAAPGCAPSRGSASSSWPAASHEIAAQPGRAPDLVAAPAAGAAARGRRRGRPVAPGRPGADPAARGGAARADRTGPGRRAGRPRSRARRSRSGRPGHRPRARRGPGPGRGAEAGRRPGGRRARRHGALRPRWRSRRGARGRAAELASCCRSIRRPARCCTGSARSAACWICCRRPASADRLRRRRARRGPQRGAGGPGRRAWRTSRWRPPGRPPGGISPGHVARGAAPAGAARRRPGARRLQRCSTAEGSDGPAQLLATRAGRPPLDADRHPGRSAPAGARRPRAGQRPRDRGPVARWRTEALFDVVESGLGHLAASLRVEFSRRRLQGPAAAGPALPQRAGRSPAGR